MTSYLILRYPGFDSRGLSVEDNRAALHAVNCAAALIAAEEDAKKARRRLAEAHREAAAANLAEQDCRGRLRDALDRLSKAARRAVDLGDAA